MQRAYADSDPACRPTSENSGALSREEIKNAQLAQRLLDAMEANERWRRYWTREDDPENPLRHYQGSEVTVAVTESSSRAALCIVGIGRCGVLSWSSDGTLHVVASKQIPSPSAQVALDESMALVSEQRRGDGPVKGDFSAAPTFSRPSVYVPFTARVRYPELASYEEDHRRFAAEDGVLIDASREEAARWRRRRCGAGRLSVPLVMDTDSYADVYVELGGSCERGFFLWRRNELNRWSFEKFNVAPQDIAFLQRKLKPLKQTVIALPAE